jgi:hypothetical protein
VETKKTVLYRLLGVGRIREPLLSELKAEDLLLLDEGIPGSITYLNFRAPGRFANWKRQWFTAAIALTKARLLLQRCAGPFLSIPGELMPDLHFSNARGVLLIAFEAASFSDKASGRLECRFRTSQAQLFVDALQERVAAYGRLTESNDG